MNKFKILFVTLILLITCSCTTQHNSNLYIEQTDNFIITYMYNSSHTRIESKSIYDTSNGITTTYLYYYKTDGYGTYLVDSEVIIVDNNGNILSGE